MFTWAREVIAYPGVMNRPRTVNQVNRAQGCVGTVKNTCLKAATTRSITNGPVTPFAVTAFITKTVTFFALYFRIIDETAHVTRRESCAILVENATTCWCAFTPFRPAFEVSNTWFVSLVALVHLCFTWLTEIGAIDFTCLKANSTSHITGSPFITCITLLYYSQASITRLVWGSVSQIVFCSIPNTWATGLIAFTPLCPRRETSFNITSSGFN